MAMLDGMDQEELWAWALKFNHAGPKLSSELFAEKQPGYVKATRNMAHYAFNKSTAMRCRASGDILAAQKYDAICEQIYNSLPKFAKW